MPGRPSPSRRAGDSTPSAGLESEVASMWNALELMKASQEAHNTQQTLMMTDVHRAIVGTTDGTHKGIHRRLDGFESVVFDHGERMIEVELKIEAFDRIREERGAILQDHANKITRNAEDIKALQEAKKDGLGRWWVLALGMAGALFAQILALLAGLIQAALTSPIKPPHP